MSATDLPAPTTPLDDPLESLSGVGAARARALRAAGLETLADLLRRFPRGHDHLPAPSPADDLPAAGVATVVAPIRSRRLRSSRRGRGGHLEVELDAGRSGLRFTLYNQGFLHRSLEAGDRLRVTLRTGLGDPVVLDHRVLGAEEPVGGAELRPRVAPIPGISPGIHRRLLDESLARVSAAIEDPLPSDLRRARGLPELASALRAVHRPETPEEVGPAEERLLYHGFLAAALRVESGRGERGSAAAGPVIDIDASRDREIRTAFPFAFTDGQSAAVDAIRADLVSPRPMRRLLQGDVGCGKTAVAIWSALAVARGGAQAAILAPTETLARQFHSELARAAATFGLEAVFLSGSARRAERRRAEEALASGEILLAVGTTAILSERSPFARLALAVVDEQHRFGVLQRLRLVQKAVEPNLLAMSATPIPRTLALSLFSDLDHSEIRERPPGRVPVRTLHHVEERDGAFPWAEIADAARAGEKAFIVFPAIESETESIPSLLREGREIARRHFRGVPMAALHGRMGDEEKAENLARFRTGDVRVLFATTVIEVGVDVPDARTIAILGASRFGLAQLHQLRGRVGRGGQGGTCVLMTRTRESAESERLQTLVDCDDGFAIAERDLDLRGPGDMMGLRQHGLVAPARGAADEGLFIAAFEDARELVRRPGLDATRLADELEIWARRPRARGRELMDAG